MNKPKSKTKRSPNPKSTIAMFKELKRAQIEDVRVLMKAVPKLIAAQAQDMTTPERNRLEDKIRKCKEQIRFCYWLYTDAVSLLGPKPKWLTEQ
jgi:hypothetical protein